jgi:excisionase family DNA binding protein
MDAVMQSATVPSTPEMATNATNTLMGRMPAVVATHRVLITAREVAERLRVGRKTILKWTRQGALPGFRLPSGALRYREADLAQWLEERATPGQGVASPISGVGDARQVRYPTSPTSEG